MIKGGINNLLSSLFSSFILWRMKKKKKKITVGSLTITAVVSRHGKMGEQIMHLTIMLLWLNHYVDPYVKSRPLPWKLCQNKDDTDAANLSNPFHHTQEMLSNGHFGKSKGETTQINFSNDYCHNIKMGAIINIVLMLDYNSSAQSLE